MYRINSTWTSFDIDLKNLKQVLLKNQCSLSMIGNVMKKYRQNAINQTNTGSVSGEISNIETRYFKLTFIGMYSKATQNKIEKLCERIAKMPKLNQFSPAINCVRHSRIKIFMQVSSVQRLYINLFVLAVILVMLVKRTDISQPGIDEHIGKDKSRVYTNPYCH